MAFREVYWKDTHDPEYKQVIKPDGKIGYERATIEHQESASMGSTIDWDKVERANAMSRMQTIVTDFEMPKYTGNQCRWCGAEMPRLNKRGRPRKFCTPACGWSYQRAKRRSVHERD